MQTIKLNVKLRLCYLKLLILGLLEGLLVVIQKKISLLNEKVQTLKESLSALAQSGQE